MLCLLIITERSFFSALIQKRRDESKHFSVPAANGKEKKIVLTYRDIIIGKPLDGPAPAKSENNEDDDDTDTQPAGGVDEKRDDSEEEVEEVEDGGDKAKDKGLCLF